MWKAIKKSAKWFEGKSVTIGLALVAVSEIPFLPDEVKGVAKVVGILLGGGGFVDNYRKGRYKK